MNNIAFCAYGSCIILAVQSDYFLKQEVDICNGEVRRTGWILNYLNELRR